eukprot:15131025-Alexandrium_andersonii.AAC.1
MVSAAGSAKKGEEPVDLALREGEIATATSARSTPVDDAVLHVHRNHVHRHVLAFGKFAGAASPRSGSNPLIWPG